MMKKHTIKFTLGSAVFGMDYGITNQHGRLSDQECIAILAVAKQANITTIDTSPNYGDAEKRMGEILIDKHTDYTSKFFVPESIKSSDIDKLLLSIENSITNLNCSQLTNILLHNPDALEDERYDVTQEIMSQIKQKNLAKNIGISVYTVEQTIKILQRWSPDIVQFPINLFNQSFKKSCLLKELSNSNIKTQARSIFLQGILLSKTIPEKLNIGHSHFDLYQNWLHKNSVTALQACLSYIQDTDNIEEVLIGVSTSEELRCIIESEYVPRLNYGEISCNDDFLNNPSKWNL